MRSLGVVQIDDRDHCVALDGHIKRKRIDGKADFRRPRNAARFYQDVLGRSRKSVARASAESASPSSLRSVQQMQPDTSSVTRSVGVSVSLAMIS